MRRAHLYSVLNGTHIGPTGPRTAGAVPEISVGVRHVCNKGVGDVGTGPNSRTEQNRHVCSAALSASAPFETALELRGSLFIDERRLDFIVSPARAARHTYGDKESVPRRSSIS